MSEIILHVGLHKTATKFWQHKVFNQIDASEITYNPAYLTQLCCDLIKADEDDYQAVVDEIEREVKRQDEAGHKKILISRECLSGDMFRFYYDYSQTVKRIKEAFPEAKILFFMRYQSDWIESLYRETLHAHHFQSIDEFLCFKGGNSSFIHNHYHRLDLKSYIEKYLESYGKDFHLFFYENFKVDQISTLSEIRKILGVKKIRVKRDRDTIPNRGYSWLAIKVSIFRFKTLRMLGLKRWCHRPILYFGKDSIPSGFEDLSILPKHKYWGEEFRRDNEEVRKPGYPNNLTKLDKVKLRLSWRFFIKQVFDKIVYVDKDLLSSKRSVLDKHFKKENAKLLNIVQDCQVPKEYYD